jgi:hypothetical protein
MVERIVRVIENTIAKSGGQIGGNSWNILRVSLTISTPASSIAEAQEQCNGSRMKHATNGAILERFGRET